MRKIVLSLIYGLIVISLSLSLSIVAKNTAVAAEPVEGTVIYVCSANGENYKTLNECEDSCTTTSGIEGFCTKTVVIGPNYVIKLINKYTQWFIIIVSSIAVIMIIIGGLQFMLARGSEEKIKTARKMILWAILGLAIVLLAGGAIWTITQFLTTK